MIMAPITEKIDQTRAILELGKYISGKLRFSNMFLYAVLVVPELNTTKLIIQSFDLL
jgi:hypothetical protein